MFELHTLYTVLHIIGAVLGAGGAFMADAMFFSCMKDRRIDSSELRLLKLASTMVWVGVLILLISGALLFFEDTERYLNSSKFLVKMTVVAVIIVNGIFFHYTHIPRISRHKNKHLPSSKVFVQKSGLLFASGAISAVSWLTSLVLGSIRSIPYTYTQGIVAYVILLAIAIAAALVMKKKMMKKR